MSKISLLIPDLSQETYNRTKSLYEMLKNNYELEVISINKESKNKLFKDNFQDYKQIKYDLGTIINDLKKNVTGEIIYAIKSKPTSFGFAMSLKNIKKIPVVLDISAKETYNCFPYTDSTLKGILSSFYLVNDTNSYVYTKILEKRIKLVDEITVSSISLQKIYGGTLINTSSNENLFNPSLYKKNEIKETMGWTNKKIIFFGGTINRDTDIDLLINSIESINRDDLILVIVGDNKKYKESEKVNYIGYQPPENIAKLLSVSDIVVIPQKNTHSSFGKIPIKFYDAMSSGIPIICPDIYDFSNNLNQYCYLYENGSKDSLVNNILKVLDNYQDVKSNREIYIEKFGFEKMSKKICDFFSKFESKTNS
jgi:glycosyltransferase involved in cell wall biosynthesis